MSKKKINKGFARAVSRYSKSKMNAINTICYHKRQELIDEFLERTKKGGS